jgi:hypothetical protein
MDESTTSLLRDGYGQLDERYSKLNEQLPINSGLQGKLRRLDCLVINSSLGNLLANGIRYDTVRGAFLEGEPVYPGAGFSSETHIQVAVRNLACVIGVFRPNL